MKRNRIIMSWSKCRIEVGFTDDEGGMATELVSVGTINDKSTTLATADGDKLEAKATGGVVVASEEDEPVVTLTTRVKEMDFDTEGYFTGATLTAENELEVKTNIVKGDMSFKLTPKNIGATGIKAPCTSVAFRPGSSEEEGAYVDLTFTIHPGKDNVLYRKFKVKESDWADPKFAQSLAKPASIK